MHPETATMCSLPTPLGRDANHDTASSSETEVGLSSEHFCYKPEKSFLDILFRFSERTSCVGPSYIGSSRSWHARTCWIAIFLSAIAMTIYMLYLNFEEYGTNATKSSVSIGFQPLRFPMVTFCNSNPVRRSAIDKASIEYLRDFLNDLANRKEYDITVLQSPNGTVYFEGELPDSEEGAKRAPRSQIQDEFQYLFGQESSEVKLAMGHQLQDMMISCSFSGVECRPEDFTATLSNEYGNCFSFNYDALSNLTSSRSGNRNGLEMILYLENGEYISGLASGYGARISIDERGTNPLPEIDGLYLSAGSETDVGMKLINISRLGGEYGDCKQISDLKAFSEDYVYTRQACQVRCLYMKIREACDCVMISKIHLYPPSILDDPNLKLCYADSDISTVSCVENMLMWADLYDNVTCTCPKPCNETTYDTVLSQRDWPTNDYLDALQHTVCAASERATDCDRLQMITETGEKRRNFLKVNVFYRDLNYEVITEDPAYPDSQFYSDLGGSVGLFLGLSVLSLIEIGQLLLEIAEWGLGKVLGTERKKSQRFEKADHPLTPRFVPDTSQKNTDYRDHARDYRDQATDYGGQDVLAPIRYVQNEGC